MLAAAAGCGGSSGPLGESEYDQCLTWMRGVGRGTEQVSAQQRQPLTEAGFEPGRWPRGTVPTEAPIAVCQYAYVWDQVGENGELSGTTLAAIAVCSMEREGCAHPDL